MLYYDVIKTSRIHICVGLQSLKNDIFHVFRFLCSFLNKQKRIRAYLRLVSIRDIPTHRQFNFTQKISNGSNRCQRLVRNGEWWAASCNNQPDGYSNPNLPKPRVLHCNWQFQKRIFSLSKFQLSSDIPYYVYYRARASPCWLAWLWAKPCESKSIQELLWIGMVWIGRLAN